MKSTNKLIALSLFALSCSALAEQPLFNDCSVTIKDPASGAQLHTAVLKTMEPETSNPMYDQNGTLAGFSFSGRQWGAASGCLGSNDIYGSLEQAKNGSFSKKLITSGKDRVLQITKNVFIDYCYKMSDGTTDSPGYAEIYLAKRTLSKENNFWLAASRVEYLNQPAPLIIRGEGASEMAIDGYILSAKCTLSKNP